MFSSSLHSRRRHVSISLSSYQCYLLALLVYEPIDSAASSLPRSARTRHHISSKRHLEGHLDTAAYHTTFEMLTRLTFPSSLSSCCASQRGLPSIQADIDCLCERAHYKPFRHLKHLRTMPRLRCHLDFPVFPSLVVVNDTQDAEMHVPCRALGCARIGVPHCEPAGRA